jgi:hypothetical protein
MGICRGKNAEQEKRSVRIPIEVDAVLAVGLILRGVRMGNITTKSRTER